MAITLNRSSKLNGNFAIDHEGASGNSMPDPGAANDLIFSTLFNAAVPPPVAVLATESPSALSLGIALPGNYTIDDDGIPGNNTSVIRDGTGTVIYTFAHPVDALTFTTIPGVNLSVNITDTLGAANFTIGSLTAPGSRPDSLQIGGVFTSGIVTLTANGAITEFGSDAAIDISAGKLFLDAGTGIGALNPIETLVSQLEAESVTGGINLANIGSLTIGGAAGTADLRGLFTGTSGNIRLVNQGSITLADQDGVESAHSAGNLTLNAIGSTANISSIVNRDALFATGNIVLSAGQDILFGRTGADFDNDVRAGGFIDITAARDFALDGFSDMASDDQGRATNGGITVIAGRDLLIDDANGVDASLGVTASASLGSIYLQTGIGGILLLHANSSAAIQGRNGGVTIKADTVDIEPDSGINVTGTGSVTLTTASAGRAISLGAAGAAVFDMRLTDAELDRIVAANLVIGSAEAGLLNIESAVSFANNNVTLRSGEDITINASISAPSALNMFAAESIVQSGGVITAPFFNATVDSPDFDPAGGTLIVTNVATSVAVLNGSADNDIITDNNGAHFINGGAGNDVLTGAGGGDSIAGGTGDDIYVVVDGAATLIENADEGMDTVQVAFGGPASFTLGANFENLIFSDSVQHRGTGNSLANVILGGDGVDELFGEGGNDTLRGFSGNDSLDGGTGADSMFGSAGDDIYAVDDAGDQAIELAGQGNDRVLASVSYRLVAGSAIELLTAANLAGTTALDLAGNELAQTILGNDGANTLEGLGGNDALQGFAGNDSLDGGTGADTMFGGAGDDIYVVDNSGDQAIEAAGEGSNDRVLASANFTLNVGSEVELLAALDLAGVGALDLAGNEFAQILIGNDGVNNLYGFAGNDTLQGLGGNDSLDGGAGTDTMFGGLGDDIYAVDNAGDQAIEAVGQGSNDRVLASVNYQLGVGSEIELIAALDLAGTGALDLTGNELGQTIIGNAGVNALGGGGGNDTLQGLEGSDLLDGGLGADMLVGGTGADLLVFASALGGGNIDTIIGFVSGTDGIAIDNSVFTGLANGALPASAFVVGNGALDADDRIIYDPATGALFFDVDGNGGVDAVQFAVLQGAPALAASDFTVI